MDSREHSDLPPAPSYPSPNAAQVSQGTTQYYSNRQLTDDELLSAELSKETSGANIADAPSNGEAHHAQQSSSGAEMGRSSTPSQHQQQHMLQFTPNQQVGADPNHDLSYGDESARRKRTKISRACDECRRKKVRCDANSESGVETCSNCRRLGVVCQFSRVPMKRGPSKGYIKELAERLHTLESQIQTPIVQPDMQYQPMNEASPPRTYHDFTAPVDGGNVGRKRTYSVFDGLPTTSFTQFNPRVSQGPFGEPPTDPENPAVVNNTGPKPGNLFWASANEHGLPQGPFDVSEGPKQAGEEDTAPLKVDDACLNAYYANIHPFFPVLPHSKDRLLAMLQQCSLEIQEIFLHSLFAVTRTSVDRVANVFQRTNSFDDAQYALLHHSRQPALAHSNSVNIVLLQTLLLMIVDCDSRGPENLLAKNGLPKHSLLQSAIKLGFELARIFSQLKSRRSSEPEIDADPNLVRRNWIVLTVLARWHAVSVADSSLLGNYEIGGPEDARIAGVTLAQLASYSTFLAEMATLVTIDPNVCQASTGMGRLMAANLVASLERLSDVERFRKFQENPDDAVAHSFLDSLEPQLYWTIRLLVKRHIFVYSPYEVISCAQDVVNEMHKAYSSTRQATPFDLHSLVLASMTLLEATVLPEYANECWESVKKIEDILDRREKQTADASEFNSIFATPGWDARIRAFVDWRRAKALDFVGESVGGVPQGVGLSEQRSLQHLADLAVGAEGPVATGASSSPPAENVNALSPKLAPLLQSQGRIVVDFTMLTKEGYLNVLAGLAYRGSRQ